ncbi:hypothetical protein NLI96_g95 [Meripilus lineatus]|uniref:Ceramide very long chain fatty acid hydroxylase n=1 Tax=Meripilus lineatus TaxID=2056292 RepID=A0AAD5VED1_9APHY|nr:hypothetical protein NLI96_g95 [Physisporinus lineatus]
MSKRTRIYAKEDIAEHTSPASCWVTRNGKVYDVTGFLADHPGGEEYILKYAGKDIDEVMKDATEHDHSDAAYDMLHDFFIGRVGHGENTVSDDWSPDNFVPEETETSKDYEKNEFIDLRVPIIMQVWHANFSKAYYLQQVHQPRHLPQPARFFGPGYLEIFTRTAWYVIPSFWLPIASYLFIRSLLQFTFGDHSLPAFTRNPVAPIRLFLETDIPLSAVIPALLCFGLGNIIWTILEYTLHRFLFHLDYYLPDHPAALTLHFLLHGVHHYLPMDRLRLVMPPVLFIFLSTPFTRLAHVLFPASIANGIIAGAFTFYVLYDVMHYAFHHSRLPPYLQEMKKYHLAHHYKNFDLGFGVTSKFWDVIFNTVIPI